MPQFIVESDFWSIFPDARLGVMTVRNLDNSDRELHTVGHALTDAHTDALTHVPHEEWTANDVVKRWRDAFQQFKTKKGARSSIEALLKRVKNGNTIGSINPLVDVYNTISLAYGVPVGGEDLDKVVGDVRLTVAKGGESFLPLGAESDEPALPGEVIYCDDEGAMCRGWNWREAQRTMLTNETTDAVMVLEAVDNSTDEAFWSAVDGLADAIRTRLSADVIVHRITRDAPSVELG